MQVENVRRLGDGQRAEVLTLVESATGVDKVAPLSEEVLLDARDPHSADSSSATAHLLAYAGEHLAGYAHLQTGLAGGAATAEVVVDPHHRRHGVATALIHALQDALEPPGQ